MGNIFNFSPKTSPVKQLLRNCLDLAHQLNSNSFLELRNVPDENGADEISTSDCHSSYLNHLCMKSYEQLLLENKAWSEGMRAADPGYFERLINIQQPDYLWIGCSDSRVPPNLITQTQPGEIFIHRNIANLAIHTDLNMFTVLQYAVEILNVKHIVVCGHYGCGGVKAAMTNKSFGIINKWLRHIKDIYRLHQQEIDALPEEQRTNRLVEINVREQVYNLAKTSIVQRSWKSHNSPTLFGWVYDLKDGIINPILKLDPGSPLDHPIYEYDNLEDAM